MQVLIKKCDCVRCLTISTLNYYTLNSLFLKREYRLIVDSKMVMGNSVRQKIIQRIICLLLSLSQRKFMPALRAFSHSTLHGRRTPTTCECSTIRYVKCESAFWTFNYMFRLHAHSKSLILNQPSRKILKTFLNDSKRFYAKILTILKTINKDRKPFHMNNCWHRTN